MYFVHFCMFGENGMNIRNECVHGLDYCQGNRVEIGVKATLLSLYMVEWRMQVVLDNMKKEESKTEEINQENQAEENVENKTNRIVQLWKWLIRQIRRILSRE